MPIDAAALTTSAYPGARSAKPDNKLPGQPFRINTLIGEKPALHLMGTRLAFDMAG